MATFQVNTPSGSYRITAPDDATQDQVMAVMQAHVPEAFAPPASKPNDLLSYIKQGAVGSAEDISSFTGIHNPLEAWTERQKASIAFSPEEQARQKRSAAIEKASEGKGALAAGLGKLQSMLVDPQAIIGQTIGGAAPYVAPLAMAATAPFEAVPAAVAGVGGLALGALGVMGGAGMMKRGMYDAVKQATTEQGAPPAQAEAAALKASSYTGPNSALIAGGGLLGILDAETGIGGMARKAVVSSVAKTFAKGMGEEVAEKTAVAGAKEEAERTVGQAALAGIAKEVPSQAIRSGFQRFGVNEALSNAGVPTSPFQGVLGEVIAGGVSGGLFGGVAGAVQQVSARRAARLADVAARPPFEGTGAESATVPLADREKAVQRYIDLGYPQAEAEQLASGGKKGVTSASDKLDVGGAKPDLQGVGGGDAAAGIAGATATPEAGGLGAVEPRAGGFGSAEGAANAPLEPPTRKVVKAGLVDMAAETPFKIPSGLVDTVHGVMTEAHAVGKPISLPDALDAATADFVEPKFSETTTAVRALVTPDMVPAGVKITQKDIGNIHSAFVTGRGVVPLEDLLGTLIDHKLANAPPKVVEAASAKYEEASGEPIAQPAVVEAQAKTEMAQTEQVKAATPRQRRAAVKAADEVVAQVPPDAPPEEQKAAVQQAQATAAEVVAQTNPDGTIKDTVADPVANPTPPVVPGGPVVDQVRALVTADMAKGEAATLGDDQRAFIEAQLQDPNGIPPSALLGQLQQMLTPAPMTMAQKIAAAHNAKLAEEAAKVVEAPPEPPPALAEPSAPPPTEVKTAQEEVPPPAQAQEPAPEPPASEALPAPEPLASEALPVREPSMAAFVPEPPAPRERIRGTLKLKSKEEIATERAEPTETPAEGKFTDTEEKALGGLDKAEQETVAEHYGEPEFNDAAKRSLLSDVAAGINKGWETIHGAIRDIARKVAAAVMSVSLVLNPAGLHNVHLAMHDPARAVAMHEVLTPPPPGVAREASPGMLRAYSVVMPQFRAGRLSEPGKGIVFIDKPNGRAYFMDGKGALYFKANILTGETLSDLLPKGGEVGSLSGLNEAEAGKKVTPAGVFRAQRQQFWKEYTTGNLFKLQGADTASSMVAIHAVWEGAPKERRDQRLASGDPAQSRISNGCINTKAKDFITQVLPHANELDGAPVVIVPDAQSATDLYLSGKVQDAATRIPVTPEMATTEAPPPFEPGQAPVHEDQGLPTGDERRLQAQERKGGRRRKGKPVPEEAVADMDEAEQEATAEAKAQTEEDAQQNAAEEAVPKQERIQGAIDKLSKAEARNQELISRLHANDRAFGGKASVDDYKDMLGAIGNSLRENSPDNYEPALKDIGPPDNQGVPAIAQLPERLYKFIVSGMLSSGIANLFEPALPRIREALDISAQTHGFREKLSSNLVYETGSKIKDFTSKSDENNTLLANVMSLSKSTGVDATMEGDLASHDPIIKKYEDAIANTKTPVAKWEAELAMRKDEVRLVQRAVDLLKAKDGGLEVLREMKDNHEYVSNMLLHERTSSIREANLADPSKGEEIIKLMEEELDNKSGGNSKGMDKRYSLMPIDEMPKTYYPSMRFGNYWLGVKDSTSGRHYYMFDTLEQLNATHKQVAADLGVPMDSRLISRGDNRTQLRALMSGESKTLQKVFNMIDKLEWKPGMSDKDIQDRMEALKDSVLQTQIQSMPERSYMKRMLHFKDITGASNDVYRSYVTSMEQAVSQLTKMRFGPKADSIFKGLHEYVRPSDGSETRFSNTMVPKLETAIHALEERYQVAMNPSPQNVQVAFLNRFAGLMYMTSPASALANMTSLFIRVYPRLFFQHGPIGATRVMTKWLNLLDSMGMEVVGPNGKLKLTAPDVMNSNLVRNNPLNRKAGEYALARGVFGTALSAQLGTRPSSHAGALGAADNFTRKLTTFLTAGLGFSEKATRQLTFFSAFELQMAKERKAGIGTHDEQFKRAADYAIKTVTEAVGDPSAAEHPMWMGQGWGRAFALFKRFSLSQTRFLLGSLYHAAGAARKGNAKEFAALTGELAMSLGMVGLFSGVVGMPAYGMIMAMIDAYDDKFLTPEEKIARRQKYGIGALNARLRFEQGYLPEKFGGIQVTSPVDGLKHSLANMIINGPISELTDENIGKRVGVDGLWIRGIQGGRDLSEVAINTAIANVAGLSMAQNTLKGVDDMGNGMVERGLEHILPAGIKGFFTAGRYASEGARTRDDKTMMEPEKFTGANLLGAIMGLQPTKLSTVVDNHYAVANIIHNAGVEQKKLLDNYKLAVLDMNNPSADPEAIPKIVDRIAEYNKKYPLMSMVITYDMMLNSLKSAAQNRAMTVYGTTVTKKNFMDVVPMLMAAQPVDQGAYEGAQ